MKITVHEIKSFTKLVKKLDATQKIILLDILDRKFDEWPIEDNNLIAMSGETDVFRIYAKRGYRLVFYVIEFEEEDRADVYLLDFFSRERDYLESYEELKP